MPDPRRESPAPAPPRLLDRVRAAIRARNYSPRTEEAYVFWIRRFIVFMGKRHPDTMGAAEVNLFLSHLAISRKVSGSTQNQALSALLFLYRRVLNRDLDAMPGLIRAKRSIRRPVVLSPREVSAIHQQLRGLPSLAVVLMYGSGLRLLETLSLRVQDLDFERGEIVVVLGKGLKDRRTILPKAAVRLLKAHLEQAQQEHVRALNAGRGRALIPEAVARNTPEAAYEWAWQWVFPGSYVRSARLAGRRHLHKSVIQRAFSRAARLAGITKEASCQSLRHSFATHLVEAGTNIRVVQELMGHKNVATTMIYTGGLYRGDRGIWSPFDAIPTHRFLPQPRPEED